MNITIKKADHLPDQIHLLADHAQQENFQQIKKLINEYQQQINLFNRSGEFLLLAYDDDQLVACGGLNTQINEQGEPSRIGRVRRFYVLPKYRQSGLGKRLLQELERHAKPNFSALCLRTELTSAARFFQKQNYVFVENHPNYNYFKYLI